MNQILFDKNINNNYVASKASTNKIYIFRILFFICLFLIILLITYYCYFWYILNQKEDLSYSLKDSFNIRQLYSNVSYSYTTVRTLNDYVSSTSNFSVIGIVEIPKIDISYPILSSISDELLKIAPCRFYGPLPNEIGNLCIAGHNYKNSKFFSKLKNLEKNDIIKIRDLTGKNLDYVIYDIFETSYDDISCISQETNNKREITLITCNTQKDKRTIVKAKERD